MTKTYTRPEKAVIFLMTLDEGTVGQVLDSLEEREIQRVANYMTKLEDVDTQVMDMVSKEFYDLISYFCLPLTTFYMCHSFSLSEKKQNSTVPLVSRNLIFYENLERAKGFEPSTSTLARLPTTFEPCLFLMFI